MMNEQLLHLRKEMAEIMDKNAEEEKKIILEFEDRYRDLATTAEGRKRILELEKAHGSKEKWMLAWGIQVGVDVAWGRHVAHTMRGIPESEPLPEWLVLHFSCMECPEPVRAGCWLFRISKEDDSLLKAQLFHELWPELWEIDGIYAQRLGISEEAAKAHLLRIFESRGVASSKEISNWFGLVTDQDVLDRAAADDRRERTERLNDPKQRDAFVDAFAAMFSTVDSEKHEALYEKLLEDGAPETLIAEIRFRISAERSSVLDRLLQQVIEMGTSPGSSDLGCSKEECQACPGLQTCSIAVH